MTRQVQHCFIAPTQYLHLIPKKSKTHLLLAHLLEDDAYCEFYRNRKKNGDYIIVDNGAFEFKRPLSADEIFRLVGKAGFMPDVVVAPDYPFEHWGKTVSSTIDFSKRYHQYFDATVKLMAVPQSKKGNWKGWIECYKQLADVSNVDWLGMSILGIPNAFCSLTGTDDISFNRTFATAYLIAEGIVRTNRKHHYLGCGDPRELITMCVQGVADTNDSSTAFWHAINGIAFDDSAGGLKDGKLAVEVDFDLPFDAAHTKLIKSNIKWIGRLDKIDSRATKPAAK